MLEGVGAEPGFYPPVEKQIGTLYDLRNTLRPLLFLVSLLAFVLSLLVSLRLRAGADGKLSMGAFGVAIVSYPASN